MRMLNEKNKRENQNRTGEDRRKNKTETAAGLNTPELTDRRWTDRFSYFCTVFSMIVLFVIMIYLSFASFLETTDMNMNNSMLENVEYHKDNFIFNLVMLVLFSFIVFVYSRLIKRVDVRIIISACIFAVLAMGLVWTFSSLSAPTHDSLIVSRAAYKASLGDYSDIDSDYFKRFPFQLGYVFFSEIIIRLFNTGDNYLVIEVINVICLAVSYLAVLMSVRIMFGSEKTVKICALLMVFCFPAILFCTFTYGNIPGLMFASLAVWQYLGVKGKSLKSDILHGVLCALFIGISVSIKKNYMIVMAAILIIAVVRAIERKRFLHLACALLCVISVWGCSAAVVRLYEGRAGCEFGDGIPMISWLAMGLNESEIAPGWYNGKYTVTNFHENGMDTELAAEDSVKEIKERLEFFREDKTYAGDFFGEKIISQWNEPTYQSIWTNQVRGRYGDMGKIASWVCGDGEAKVKGFMDLYMQFVYAMTACAALLIIKKRDIVSALFGVVIIGGFLYHTLFEAKSQYAISYFILMIPLAAYALDYACGKADGLFKAVKEAWNAKKIKNKARG